MYRPEILLERLPGGGLLSSLVEDEPDGAIRVGVCAIEGHGTTVVVERRFRFAARLLPCDLAEQERSARGPGIELRELARPPFGGDEPAGAQVENRVVVHDGARVAEECFAVGRARFAVELLRYDPRAVVLDPRLQRGVRSQEERLALLLLA